MNERLDVERDEGKVEEQELVELGEASVATKGPGWGPWADPGGWPKPYP